MKPLSARLVFALKLFAAAMISYVVSVRMGMANNYWPVVTCMVLANPLHANLRARSVYRFFGTVCGALASVLLAIVFGNIPVLQLAMSGVLIALAFGLSTLDRTPRSYAFLLFGVTMVLILTTGLANPLTMFTTAISRVSEIGLGILVMALVDALFPANSLAGQVRDRVQGWTRDIEEWLDATMRGHAEDARGSADRIKVIADATSLSELAGQLSYDTGVSERERQLLFAIQRRILLLVPYVSAIGARLAQSDPAQRDLLIRELTLLWEAARPDTVSRAQLQEIAGGFMPEQRHDSWHELVRCDSFEIVLDALVEWTELRHLVAALESAEQLPEATKHALVGAAPFRLRPDPHITVRVTAAIALSFGLLCLVWGMTGWDRASDGLLFAVVTLGFFGAADAADRAIVHFSRFALFSTVLAGLLNYAMLPLANDLASFLLVMAVFITPLAAWAASNPMARLTLISVFSTINLQARYTPPAFDVFLNSTLALLLGVFLAYFSLLLLRRMGSAHALARFASYGRADMVAMTRTTSLNERDAFLDRALDRIGVMNARLAATGEQDQSADLLARLRAGVNIAALATASRQMAGELASQCERLLGQIRSDIGDEQPGPDLLAAIDRTLSQALGELPRAPEHTLIRSLLGLRFALYRDAPALNFSLQETPA